MSRFFFSLSLFLSPDYVVSPPISLEKGKDARARKNRAGGVLKRREGRRRRRIERCRVSPRRWTRVLPRCSFASGARGWKRRYSYGFGKEEIKSEEGSADFWTREILQFCPSDSSSLGTFDRSFFCPDTRDGDVKLTICRAFLFLIEQHQIHQVSLLGHLQLGH